MPFYLHIKVKSFSALRTSITSSISVTVLVGSKISGVLGLVRTLITFPYLATMYSLVFNRFSFIFKPLITLFTFMFQSCQVTFPMNF